MFSGPEIILYMYAIIGVFSIVTLIIAALDPLLSLKEFLLIAAISSMAIAGMGSVIIWYQNRNRVVCEKNYDSVLSRSFPVRSDDKEEKGFRIKLKARKTLLDALEFLQWRVFYCLLPLQILADLCNLSKQDV